MFLAKNITYFYQEFSSLSRIGGTCKEIMGYIFPGSITCGATGVGDMVIFIALVV
jgi:hypothetical protein